MIKVKVRQVIKSLQDEYSKESKVVVGLSGGVDSAVTAWILKEAGFNVSAVFLKCYPNTPGCRSEEDLKDAIKVASQLSIPLTTMDFIEEYRQQVLDEFYAEYAAGRTPNPDIWCNSRIKFGLFFDMVMDEIGADYFATGHYVRKIFDEDSFSLAQGYDKGKDQSYFLYRIPQNALERSIFPLGALLKDEVRELASDLKLPVSDKKDSTGICFIGQVDLKDFLKDKIKPKEGDIITTGGEIIGKHRGVWYYTLGQRRGFETSINEPVYVVEKNIERNELVVGEYEETFTYVFGVSDLFWRIDGFGEKGNQDTDIQCFVRIRNLGELVPASVLFGQGSDSKNAVNVKTHKKIQAPAPGQSAVFYKNDIVLGGGIIQ